MMVGSRNNQILFFLLLLAFVVRLFGITAHGIWIDEKTALKNATGLEIAENSQSEYEGRVFTSKELWANNHVTGVKESTIVQSGGNNIFYNTLLHFWIKLAGISDFSLRLLSAIFGLLTVLLLFVFSKEIYNNERVALLAAFIAAMHPMLIRYSQEGRAYAIGAFFVLLASLYFFRILNRNKADVFSIAIFSISVVISFLSHYLTVSVFLAQLFIFLISIGKLKRSVIFSVLAGAAFIVGTIYIWMINGGFEGIESIAEKSSDYGDVAANNAQETFALPTSAKTLFAGWSQVLLAISGNYLQGFGIQIRYIFILFLMPAFLMYYGFRNVEKERRNLIYLFLLILGSPALSTILAVRSGHVIPFQILYAIFVVPFVIVALAVGLNKVLELSKSFLSVTRVVGVAYLLLLLISLYPIHSDYGKERDINPYFYKVLPAITAEYAPGDTLCFSNWGDVVVANLYLRERGDIVQEFKESDDGQVFIRKSTGSKVAVYTLKKEDRY